MIPRKNDVDKGSKEILIFDTNIFLTGIDFNVIQSVIYTTPSIINEIDVDRYKDKNRNILNRVQAALNSNTLQLVEPSQEYVKRIEEKARITGDIAAISEADKELLALSLQLKETTGKNVKLYTNDYSMENVCIELEIPFSALLKKGIQQKINWEVYCPFCQVKKDLEDLNNPCDICNSRLRRRRVGKR